MTKDCRNDCLEPLRFPADIFNRPALPHIDYRIGSYADIREALLRNLAYLQTDLADDVLRRHLVENARATRREIAATLDAAVAAGELRRDVDVDALARTVETVIGGALMSWATYREGKAAEWIGRELEAVLAPWLPRRRRRTS